MVDFEKTMFYIGNKVKSNVALSYYFVQNLSTHS
jgi:hypothetical protein